MDFISAMDVSPKTSTGENGHAQKSWVATPSKGDNFSPDELLVSENRFTQAALKELICQIHFQLVRTTSFLNVLAKFRELLHVLKEQPSHDLLVIVYKMIAQTRDIVDGKGEYRWAYKLVLLWNDFFPSSAAYLVQSFFVLPKEQPYGSWKDFKYICQEMKERGDVFETPLYHSIRSFVLNQLKEDVGRFHVKEKISLVAKWLPREKSKYGWLFEDLATHYFNYTETAKTPEAKTRGLLKSKMAFRKLLSELNKYIDTTQIKQCANTWKDIVCSNVTSITLHKNKKAFLNTCKKGTRTYDDSEKEEDREQCAENFKEFLYKGEKGEVKIKGERIGMTDFTKNALALLSEFESVKGMKSSPKYKSWLQETSMLNLQWKDNSSKTNKLDKFIPMADVSVSMDGDPLLACIALSIRVSEVSAFKNRILTFSSNPTWVNLDTASTFTEKVDIVKKAEWGTITNFYKALDMILNVIIEKKMPSKEVNDMTLVVFSDMMIDAADKRFDSMFDGIKKLYNQTGMAVCGEPYNPPHILFWNLRSTSGFPSCSSQPNTSMLSGFSPSLLNLFCEKGKECLESLTPFGLLEESLAKERYVHLEQYLDTL
jgi:hypothetical protein